MGGWSRVPRKKVCCGWSAEHVGIPTVKALVIIVLVIAGIVGLLLTLRSSRNLGMPSDEVLKRAGRRAREQASADKED